MPETDRERLLTMLLTLKGNLSNRLGCSGAEDLVQERAHG
jgi:hypothetical protein